MPAVTRMAGWLGLILAAAAGTPIGAAELDDYPTAVRADYIFACMKTNGDTWRALERAPARSTSSRRFCHTIATSQQKPS